MTQGSSRYPKVKGRCPMGCGETLFLGAGGHVTCSWVECPHPSRVDELLAQFTGRERHMVFVLPESKIHWNPLANAAAPGMGIDWEKTIDLG